MAPSPLPCVVLAASAATFPGLERRLRRRGIRLVRLLPFRTVPGLARSARLRLLAFVNWDTLIVTSRVAVDEFLRRPEIGRLLRGADRPDVFAVGPATAAALRSAGWPPRWTARTGGATAIARRLERGRKRRILYPRSAQAGTGLARRLRRQGHEVYDPVVYRLTPAGRWPPTDAMTVRRAERIVATSPSAIAGVRRGLSPRDFETLRGSGRLIVLGERSARAARGHGFRGVRIAPTLAEQGFTRFLLRELRGGA